MTSTPTPTDERVRLTITVTPEVHDAFTRLAKASGMSLSRAMGEWLGDTLEAVTYTAQKVEEARAAPKLVMRELHAYALGLADETGQFLKTIGKAPGARPPQGGALAAGRLVPPSPRPVIRGGKSTDTGKAKGGKS